MLLRGEYGEFFPATMSPFPYNDSNAFVDFPLTKEEVEKRGWKWRDEKESNVDLSSIDTIKAEDLPDSINDAPEDILSKAIVCQETGRPFRLTPFELNFYRTQQIPLPRKHPDVRIAKMLEHKTPHKLFDATCAKCGTDIKTGHNPKYEYTVYCEDCYREAVL